MYLHLFDVPKYLCNSLSYNFESIPGDHLNDKASQKNNLIFSLQVLS